MRFPSTRTVWALRTMVGCLAAYAVALQIAVSGLVAISWLQSLTPLNDAVICSEHPSETGHPPSDNGSCPCGPACTMSGCAVIIGSGATSVTIPWPVSQAWLLPSRPYLPPSVTKSASKAPHAPRAPPQA